MNISIDKNVLNNFQADFLSNIFKPFLEKERVTVHLTDPLFLELFIDDGITRRAGHADALRKILNGKIILPITQLIDEELTGSNKVFYEDTVENIIRKRIDNFASKELVSAELTTLRNNFISYKKRFDRNLKEGQEANLAELRKRIKEKSTNLNTLRTLTFDQYYSVFPKENKEVRLGKFFTINKINYKNTTELVDNAQYPFCNIFLRGKYAYHYFTGVIRANSTLRENDASDLMYLPYGKVLDHFITNDSMLKDIGNLCYSSTDKFISWNDFRIRYALL